MHYTWTVQTIVTHYTLVRTLLFYISLLNTIYTIFGRRKKPVHGADLFHLSMDFFLIIQW